MFNQIEYLKEYRRTHKEELKKKRKIYQLTHKTEISESGKRYYESHKEEVKAYCQNRKKETAEYTRNRRKNDINFRVEGSLRTRIRKAVKGLNKSKSTIKLLGCSIKNVRKYLETKFTEGMSWDNYGYYGWHIDHIKPCCQFDLTKASEQYKCFHYTNLQPLWAEDNLKKSRFYKRIGE